MDIRTKTLRTLTVLALILTLIFLGCSPADDSALDINPYATDLVIPVDDADLEARIIMPIDTGGAVGAVIFVGGSGASGFEDYANGLNRVLIEDIFLPRGTAVVYYNKRGIGDSTGNWRRGSIERRAEDTLAVADYIRDMPGIDESNIGLVGHSQGGWVIMEAAYLDTNLAFIISLAGPTVSVAEQDRMRTEIGLDCEGVSGVEKQKALNRMDAKYERTMRVDRWFPFFGMRLFANLLRYDPEPAFRSLSIPAFLVFAENDSMVPPEQNRERFDEYYPAGAPANITWYEVPAADHLFRVAHDRCFDYMVSIEQPFAPDFPAELGAWVDGAVLR